MPAARLFRDRDREREGERETEREGGREKNDPFCLS